MPYEEAKKLDVFAIKEMGYDVSYIGTYNGIEKKLIEEIGIPYYGIASGKLRRYFDWKNFTDPFRVAAGAFVGARHDPKRSLPPGEKKR